MPLESELSHSALCTKRLVYTLKSRKLLVIDNLHAIANEKRLTNSWHLARLDLFDCSFITLCTNVQR